MERLKRIFLYLILIIFIFSIILYQFDHSHFNGFTEKEDIDMKTKLFHRIYFVVCAMSGMGYGDVSPKTIKLKIITILMQITIIMSVISELFVKKI